MQEPMADQPPPATAASTCAEYPNWRIWRSDRGRFWATRTPAFPYAAQEAVAHRTVDADDSDALREVIAEMERLAAEAGRREQVRGTAS